MKFLISLFLVISLYANIVDKIDIVVNNIPITSYQIQKTQKELNIDKNQAISYLIDKAVLDSAIKERGIYVDDFDIDNEMKQIAQKNGMSLFNFKNYLLQKGELDRLKEQIKLSIQRKKLLKTLSVNVQESDIKKYYETHQKEFMIPSTIEVTKYSSNDKSTLMKVIKNPLLNQDNSVEIKDMVLNLKDTNPDLMAFLAKYKNNTFTPIIGFENKPTSFYIIKKGDLTTLPYKVVAPKIYAMLLQKAQNQALKDFIEKLRAKADIQFLK